jgi:cyclopropane-fatty-acyl-phospholipid synthase
VRSNVGSTKDQVQVSYDVSNEFFRLWLDERMNYTSAVFENENQSLEAAQLNKLRILAEFAHITPESSTCPPRAASKALTASRSRARRWKRSTGETCRA